MRFLFLYGKVLKKDLNGLEAIERARKPSRLPVLLTREEVEPALNQISREEWMMASLLCGDGLRLMEYLRLRVKATSKLGSETAKDRKTDSRCCPRQWLNR